MPSSLLFVCVGYFIFVALLTPVASLQCYSCSDCSTVSGSTSTSNSSTHRYCYKRILSVANIKTVSRGGAVTCTSSGSSILGFGGEEFCCEKDLCNKGLDTSSSIMLIFALLTAIVALRTVATY